MISVAEARARMLDGVAQLGSEMVALEAIDGRALADAVFAWRDQPPFDAAVMDGYALAANGTSCELTIVGESAAGAAFTRALVQGEAVRISTGAPLPNGADAVVAQEDTSVRENRVIVPRVAKGQYVRARGRDFRTGARLLNVGHRLEAPYIAVLAGAGFAQAAVTLRPRVRILCNGDELVEPGADLRGDQIFDSASYAVAALARAWGADARRFSPVGDKSDAISAAVAKALADCDALVVIGGASVGPHDHVRPAMLKRGANMRVEGISVRPGRPTWFAMLPEGLPVLGLPGNPASALVCARLFLAPIIETMLMGNAFQSTLMRRAPLAQAMQKNGAREAYVRAMREQPDSPLTPILDEDSSMMSVLARSNLLVRRNPNAAPAHIGDAVEFLTWSM